MVLRLRTCAREHRSPDLLDAALAAPGLDQEQREADRHDDYHGARGGQVGLHEVIDVHDRTSRAALSAIVPIGIDCREKDVSICLHDRQLKAVGIEKMKAPATGKAEDRLADGPPGIDDSGLRRVDVVHQHYW